MNFNIRFIRERINNLVLFDSNSEMFSSGIEGNPTVFYRLIRGSTAQTNKYDTFYLQQRQENGFTWADIKVNHPLDFETNKEYNLTIRVEVRFLKQIYFLFLKASYNNTRKNLHYMTYCFLKL